MRTFRLFVMTTILVVASSVVSLGGEMGTPPAMTPPGDAPATEPVIVQVITEDDMIEAASIEATILSQIFAALFC